jgi:hypothetical protein
VSLPVFKTGAPGDPRWAGSIPVRLRYGRRLRFGGPARPDAISPAHAAARLPGRVRFPSASATADAFAAAPRAGRGSPCGFDQRSVNYIVGGCGRCEGAVSVARNK